MPASYRKALSGVRGRLVEADGKPAAGIPVELLEMLPSAFVGDYGSLFAGATPKFPELTVAKGKSGDDGVFVLEGTRSAAMHAVGVDSAGCARSTTLPARSSTSATCSARAYVQGHRVEDRASGRQRARASTTLHDRLQPGVADVARAASPPARGGAARPDGRVPRRAARGSRACRCRPRRRAPTAASS
jgi:hypothetical protein